MQVINVKANTKEWHELRRKNVGASDVSALFGLNSYKSKFQMWHEKKGNVEEEYTENINTLAGKLMEDSIAKLVSYKTGWEVRPFEGYVLHEKVRGMGCTPDYLIKCPERGWGALEIKQVGNGAYLQKWNNGEPQIDYLLQVQHQLACLGMSWGMVGAWVSGQELKLPEYERRQTTIDTLESYVKNFWDSIDNNEEPEADNSDNTWMVESKIYHHNSDDIKNMNDDKEMANLIRQFIEGSSNKKEAEKQYKTARNRIKQLLNGVANAECQGYNVRVSSNRVTIKEKNND